MLEGWPYPKWKDLFKLFDKAEHILSYDQILQVDTSLAERVVMSLDPETGSVMRHNLLPGKFVQTILTFWTKRWMERTLFMQLKLQHGKEE